MSYNSRTQAKLQGGVIVGAREPSKDGMGGVDGTAENVHEPPPDNMKGGDDACSSLEDLLHPLLTFDELEFLLFSMHYSCPRIRVPYTTSVKGSMLENLMMH